ncbi:MAG: HEAT repeat domain-containing protein [Promethearchaeota archaeon]
MSLIISIIANLITIINALRHFPPVFLFLFSQFPFLAKPFLERFINYLGSESLWYRNSAAKIIKNIGELAIPFLIEKIYVRKNSKVTEGAIEVLDKIGIPAIEKILIERINLDSAPSKLRQLELLDTFWNKMTHDHDKIEFLIRNLSSDNCQIKKSTIIAIRETKLSAAVSELENILLKFDKELSEIRKETAVALGEIRNPASKQALIFSLNYDPDWQVKSAAAEALGNIGGNECIGPLKASTLCDDWRVISAAVEALGKIKASDNDIVDRLVDLLLHSQPQVRKTAVWAMGVIGNTNTIQTLLNRLLEEEAFEVVQSIGEALVEIDTGEALRQIDKIIASESDQISNFKIDILSDSRYRINRKIKLRRARK